MNNSTGNPAAASDTPLLRDDQGGIAVLTLNRPRQRNALSLEMIAALQDCLDSIATDTSVRVVVLAANGPGFCSGHDLKQLLALKDQDGCSRLFTDCGRMMMTLTRLPQPVIASVHGAAAAAGCQLVAQCDLAIASDDAQFAVPGINLGLFCSTPAVALARNVARKKAMEMLLTGDFIDAATACELGLVNRVVARTDLDGAVSHLAQKLVAKSATALDLGKRTFYRQLEMGMEQAYQFTANAMGENMMLDDAREGIDAFLRRRLSTGDGR